MGKPKDVMVIKYDTNTWRGRHKLTKYLKSGYVLESQVPMNRFKGDTVAVVTLRYRPTDAPAS